MMNLLKLFDRKRGGKFINTFRVFDPRVNDFVYMDMYVGCLLYTSAITTGTTCPR